MSPTKPETSRADAARQRRAQSGQARSNQARDFIRNTASAPTLSRTRVQNKARPSAHSKVRRRYQVSVPFGGNASFSLPSLRIEATPRTISGVLALAMAGILALIWFVPPFVVGSAEVRGNKRLGASDVNSVLEMAGHSIVTAQPAQLKEKLQAAFPEIRDVSVQVGFPSRLIVTLTERTPLIAWEQKDSTLWVDAEGFAFPPRGTADGLITVQASGTPPYATADTTGTAASAILNIPGLSPILGIDPTGEAQTGSRRLLTPDAVLALQAIIPYLPQGSSLIYDPSYGLGWKDTRGWDAYFGQTTGDLSLKLQIYQTMIDSLTQRGIQPTMISVEFPNAPFYRVEQ